MSNNPYFPNTTTVVDQGLHTGTLTNILNCSSFTGTQGFYTRIGNYVNVQIRNLGITPSGTPSQLYFVQTLPIASNIQGVAGSCMGLLSGVVSGSPNSAILGNITADADSNRAYFSVFCIGFNTAVPILINCDYTYRII